MKPLFWLHCFHFTEVYITLDGKIRNCCVFLIEAPQTSAMRSCPSRCALGPSTVQKFLHGVLRPSPLANTTGRWMWETLWLGYRALQGVLDKQEWCLTLRTFFYFYVSIRMAISVSFLPSHSYPVYIQRPQGYIGVFLDYECGMMFLLMLPEVPFIVISSHDIFLFFPLRPFIWCGPKWSGMGHKPNQGFGNSSSWGAPILVTSRMRKINYNFTVFNFILPLGLIMAALFFKVVVMLIMSICLLHFI